MNKLTDKELALKLVKAVNDRNDFISAQGGFDAFAEVWQYTSGRKETYDKLEQAVTVARSQFDTQVADKKALVKSLKVDGEDVAANMLTSMFRIKKDSLFSRIFG